MATLSELLMNSRVGETISNFGMYLAQRQGAQGQAAQAQVQDYISQAEVALADPNYQWQAGQREAAEAFVTQAKNITVADPLQAAGMWADLQQRGIKVAGTQEVATGDPYAPVRAEKTLTPYEGGISGFFGDVNQGVLEATQNREQFEKDLENLRTLKQMGQQNAYNVALKQMDQTYGKEMLEQENVYSTEATQATLDANASWQRATSFQEQLRNLVSTDDPKNKATAQRIMDNAKAAGLLPGDLQIVQGEFDALGSGTAQMDWKDRATQSGLNEQQLKLGEQQITLGGQQIELGEYTLRNEEYVAGRRGIESALSDRAAMDDVITKAVANGDDREINNIINILEAGGSVSPDIYKALTNAGITVETLQENYGDALDSDAWRQQKHSLDMTEMKLAEGQLFNADKISDLELASAQNVYIDQTAKNMTPAEIDEALSNPRSSLSMLVGAGILTGTDIKSMRRNAGIYDILRTDEVNAPRIEQNMTMLEMLAAVPADDTKAENALRATLGQLVESGVLDETQVEGVVSSYQNAWDYGKQTQDSELASAEANRAYQSALIKVQENAATDAAATGGFASSKDKWDAMNESYDAEEDNLMNQGKAAGCFSEDGLMTQPKDKNGNPKGICANVAAGLKRVQVERQQANYGFLGALGPNGKELALAHLGSRVYTAVENDADFQGATPEDIEFETKRRLAVNWGVGKVPVKPTVKPTVKPAAAEAATAGPPRSSPGASGITRFFDTFSLAPSGTLEALSAGQSQSATDSGASSSGGRAATTPQAATQATAPQDTTIASTTGPGTRVNLRSDRDFTSVVNSVAGNGELTPVQVKRIVTAVAARYGLTPERVLELARLETTGSRASPVAAPMGFRGPRAVSSGNGGR